MKKSLLTLAFICLAIITLHSFRYMRESGIKGIVIPDDAVVMIWATNEKDTVKIPGGKGPFTLATTAGNWKVFIDAKEPYKDAVLEKVVVTEGQFTDLGEIKLQQ